MLVEFRDTMTCSWTYMVYSPRLGGQIALVDPRNDATSKNILGFTKRLLQSCVLLQFLVNRPGGLPNVQ